jgi:hypothetical protein
VKKTLSILQVICAIGCIVYGFLYFKGLREFDNVTVAMYAWALGLVGFVDAFRK